MQCNQTRERRYEHDAIRDSYRRNHGVAQRPDPELLTTGTEGVNSAEIEAVEVGNAGPDIQCGAVECRRGERSATVLRIIATDRQSRGPRERHITAPQAVQNAV